MVCLLASGLRLGPASVTASAGVRVCQVQSATGPAARDCPCMQSRCDRPPPCPPPPSLFGLVPAFLFGEWGQRRLRRIATGDKRRLLLRFATHIDSSSFIAENAPVSIWVSRLFWSWSCRSLGTSPKSALVMTVRRLPWSSSELSIVSETNAPGKIEVISFRLSFRHSSTCGGGSRRGGDVWRKGKPHRKRRHLRG